MDENKRFEVAERFKSLRDTKQELEAEVRAVNAELESVQAELIADLIENESTGFNYKGNNFSLVIKEYPAAEPERKDELYKVMREQGFEDLFTINTNTLSATVRDLKENNDGQLPAWLDGLIKIAEKTTIQIRKGRKV
jgi:hypothetical protein